MLTVQPRFHLLPVKQWSTGERVLGMKGDGGGFWEMADLGSGKEEE